jgi:hypothetical protein
MLYILATSLLLCGAATAVAQDASSSPLLGDALGAPEEMVIVKRQIHLKSRDLANVFGIVLSSV